MPQENRLVWPSIRGILMALAVFAVGIAIWQYINREDQQKTQDDTFTLQYFEFIKLVKQGICESAVKLYLKLYDQYPFLIEPGLTKIFLEKCPQIFNQFLKVIPVMYQQENAMQPLGDMAIPRNADIKLGQNLYPRVPPGINL